MPSMIRHRVNTIAGLETLDSSHGAEIDLRSSVGHPGLIHLSHDPWVLGDDFGAWLDQFSQRKIKGTLILNTKEDGLEEKAMEMLAARGLTNYFFLDTALPTLVRFAGNGQGERFAIRYSKYEPLESLAPFRGKVGWVWVDCFGGEPQPEALVAQLKPDFKICLVSPELQKRPLEEISNFLALARVADAICTKTPANWSR